MSPSTTSHDARPPRAEGPSRRGGGLVVVLTIVLLVVAGFAGLTAVYQASVRARAATGRAAAAASPPVAAGASAPVALRVARDFGATPMLTREVAAGTAQDALALLSHEATVTTSYGGGFVSSVDGVASSYSGANPVRADWFYYVNGLQAHMGAADTVVRPGDRVLWDFHRWDFVTSAPAIVGQFPAPFALPGRAAPATRVLFAAGSEPQASRIAAALVSAGATATAVAPLDAAALTRPGSIILVGRWADLSALPPVRDAAATPGASGLYARFGASGVDALGQLGGVARSLPGAGAVLATAKADEPDAALWLVTGTDASDVAAASALLADGGSRLAGRFGALVTRVGAVVSLPVAGAR